MGSEDIAELPLRRLGSSEAVEERCPQSIVGTMAEERVRIAGVRRESGNHECSEPLGRIDCLEPFGNVGDDLADHLSWQLGRQVRQAREVRFEVRLIEREVDPITRDRRQTARCDCENRPGRFGVEVAGIDFVHEVEDEPVVHQCRESGLRCDQIVPGLAEGQALKKCLPRDAFVVVAGPRNVDVELGDGADRPHVVVCEVEVAGRETAKCCLPQGDPGRQPIVANAPVVPCEIEHVLHGPVRDQTGEMGEQAWLGSERPRCRLATEQRKGQLTDVGRRGVAVRVGILVLVAPIGASAGGLPCVVDSSAGHDRPMIGEVTLLIVVVGAAPSPIPRCGPIGHGPVGPSLKLSHP